MSESEARSRRVIRSGLGRPMDFRLLSNRLSLAIPLAAGLVAGVLGLDGGLTDAVRAGISAGGSSFLAWAVTRELAPDHPVAASLAAVAAPSMIVLGSPSLAVVAVWLLATRVVAGTTGAAPYAADMVVLGAFAIWASTGEGGLPLALLALTAVASSTMFDARGRITVLVGDALATAACLAAALATGALDLPATWTSGSSWWLLATALTTTAALFVRVESSTDRRPVPIETGRVRAAVAWAGSACALAVVWRGTPGMASMAPVAAALTLTAVFSLRK